MNAIIYDSPVSDGRRREEIYQGQVFVYSPSPNTLAFVEFARRMIEEAFEGLNPITAQYHLPVERYVAVLTQLKPAFIHHPRSREFLRAILAERGCDPELTYFDVPRMRSSTSDGYLTTGIAYAFHPHRDTWYSAPMCQVNWWLPVYEVEAGNVMAFHPQYFSRAIKNGSGEYNYQQWVATSRREAARHIGKDTRRQPHPEEAIELDPQLRVVTPPGGMIVFSAAHLHSSVPNATGKTRFSIDFRTVHLEDLKMLRGARNMDAACTGTTMGDYLQLNSLAHIPEEVAEMYRDGHPQKPVTV